MQFKNFFKSIVFLSLLLGCTKHDPIPVSECPSIVSHAKSILGTMADSHEKMMSDCKKATDQQRGCAKAAKTPYSLSKCMN